MTHTVVRTPYSVQDVMVNCSQGPLGWYIQRTNLRPETCLRGGRPKTIGKGRKNSTKSTGRASHDQEIEEGDSTKPIDQIPSAMPILLHKAQPPSLIIGSELLLCVIS